VRSAVFDAGLKKKESRRLETGASLLDETSDQYLRDVEGRNDRPGNPSDLASFSREAARFVRKRNGLPGAPTIRINRLCAIFPFLRKDRPEFGARNGEPFKGALPCCCIGKPKINKCSDTACLFRWQFPPIERYRQTQFLLDIVLAR
jgi:hypothetical protein